MKAFKLHLLVILALFLIPTLAMASCPEGYCPDGYGNCLPCKNIPGGVRGNLDINPSLILPAAGFYGMNNGCPALFKVRTGDPMEFVIKVVSATPGVSSFSREYDKETGGTVLEWSVNNPKSSEEYIIAIFDKDLRLFAIGFIMRTYEQDYVSELAMNMMETLQNVESSQLKIVSKDPLKVIGLCNNTVTEFGYTEAMSGKNIVTIFTVKQYPYPNE